MSSITPLQLQQLMVSGGVSPSLVASYGQQQGMTDADMLQNLIESREAEKRMRENVQNLGAKTYAEGQRRLSLDPALTRSIQPFAPPPAAPPVVPPAGTSQTVPAYDAALAPSSQPLPTQQEIMAMQTLREPDYAGSIGMPAARFAAQSNAYTKNIRGLAADDAKLIDESAKVKAARDIELAGIEKKRADTAAAASAAISSAQDAQSAVEENVKKEIGDLYAQYKESADIDPNRFMKNQSTAGAVMSALAMAIGGGAAGVLGGPNRAADAIENRINQDIRAQIEKRNGLKDLINEKREELGDARARAIGTANMVNLKQAQDMLGYAAQYAQIEKTGDSELQRSAAGLMKNELRQKAENNIISVMEKVADLDTKALAHQAEASSQMQSLMLKQGAGQILPNQIVAVGPVEPDAPKIVSAKLAEYNALQSHLERAEELRAKAGKSGRWQGQEKQDALEAAKRAFNAERKYTNSGAALSPKETELIEMKDPNSFTVGLFDDVLGQIKARRTALKRDLGGYLKGYNMVLRDEAEKQQLTQGWTPQ